MSRAASWAPALALAAMFALVTTIGPLADDSISDLFVYRSYATGLLDGARPYADLGFEYPPLALGPIVLPGIGPESASAFELRFGGLMLLAALGVQAAVGALGGRRAAWLCVLLPLLAGALLRTRLDLVPVLFMLAGLVLVGRDRPAAGLAVLALGTATKLFPAIAAALVLVELVATGRRRDAVRAGAVFVGVLAAVCLPFAGDGFLDQFRFHLDRPVQIESAPASVLWALGDSDVTGFPVRPDPFKSNGLDGGAADIVMVLFAVLSMLGARCVCRAARARTRRSARAGPCRSRGRPGVRGARQGAVAAVPDLGAAAGRAGLGAGRPAGGGTRRCGGGPDAGVLPGRLLRSRRIGRDARRFSSGCATRSSRRARSGAARAWDARLPRSILWRGQWPNGRGEE